MNPSRQEAILTAAAYACIYFHPQAYRDPQLVAPFWTSPGKPPTRKQISYSAPSGGYRRNIIQRIQQGLDDAALAPWTGGFWRGLKLSGALVYSNKRWRINGGRPELVEDLARLSVSQRLGRPDDRGRHVLKQCYALHLPPKGADDITVLAGLFAGARLRQSASQRSHYVVPANPEVRQVLDDWALAIYNKTYRGYGLSPFYANLLMQYMPPASACRTFGVTNAAQCPLLPLAYWEVLFGDEGMPLPSRPWALPFACADITRKRHKWSHKILHQAAIKFGVAHVPPPMRQLIVDWRLNREMLYNVRYELM